MGTSEIRVRLTAPPKQVRGLAPGETIPIAPKVAPVAPGPARPNPPSRPPEEIAAEEVRKQAEIDRQFIQAALDQLTQEIGNYHRLRVNARAKIQQQMVEIAVAVAARILVREIEEDRQVIEDMVEHSVANWMDDRTIVVRLNPKDYHLMQRRLGNRLLFPDQDTSPRIVPDSSVGRGSCILEGAEGGSIEIDPIADVEKVRQELLGRITNVRS